MIRNRTEVNKRGTHSLGPLKLVQHPGKAKHASRLPTSPLEAVDAVEAAASQLVNKALKLISTDESGRHAARSASGKPLFKFDSTTFLDKGLDAINGVGKMMEGFAVTLDTVIGQAFDDWGPANKLTPGRSSRTTRLAGPGPVQQQHLGDGEGNCQPHLAEQPRADSSAEDDWGDFDMNDKENPPQRPVRTRAAAARETKSAPAQPQMQRRTEPTRKTPAEEAEQWRRRAQGLQHELGQLQAQHEENSRLKDQYTALQSTLHPGNDSGGGQGSGRSISDHGRGAADAAGEDDLAAQQVKEQMELLLREKARLAQENDRLLRENTGLQELLEFTMIQQSEEVGEDELYGTWEDGAEGQAT